jgi:hypothetical protein
MAFTYIIAPPDNPIYKAEMYIWSRIHGKVRSQKKNRSTIQPVGALAAVLDENGYISIGFARWQLNMPFYSLGPSEERMSYNSHFWPPEDYPIPYTIKPHIMLTDRWIRVRDTALARARKQISSEIYAENGRVLRFKSIQEEYDKFYHRAVRYFKDRPLPTHKN